MDYLQFAKNYITKCEERFGAHAVEATLDAAHALRDNAVDRYSRPPRLESRKAQERELERLEYEQSQYNDLWRTVPKITAEDEEHMDAETLEIARKMGLPESNLLYFLEKQLLEVFVYMLIEHLFQKVFFDLHDPKHFLL
mgnify:CR=1 FL=1